MNGLWVKKPKKIVSSVTFLFPIISLVFVFLLVINPYLLVPSYSVQKMQLWGDPSSQPGIVIFTMKSAGALTANYPINVEIEIKLSDDIKDYFEQAENVRVSISESYKYPIQQAETGMIPGGSVQIDVETLKGSGEIIFPYSGSFSQFSVFIDEEPVYVANFPEVVGSPIFVIDNYGLRLQIENNKNVGLTIISISLTVLGLILKLKDETPKKNRR